MLEKIGLKEWQHALYTPPIGILGDDGIPRGCLFGIDMPPTDDFFARDRSPDQMSEVIGAKVVYLTKEGMLKVFERLGIPSDHLCTYCIGGPYPYQKIGFPDLSLKR